MSTRFTALDIHDVCFPTSRDRDGSDAMNADPDYLAAFVALRTDDAGGWYTFPSGSAWRDITTLPLATNASAAASAR